MRTLHSIYRKRFLFFLILLICLSIISTLSSYSVFSSQSTYKDLKEKNIKTLSFFRELNMDIECIHSILLTGILIESSNLKQLSIKLSKTAKQFYNNLTIVSDINIHTHRKLNIDKSVLSSFQTYYLFSNSILQHQTPHLFFQNTLVSQHFFTQKEHILNQLQKLEAAFIETISNQQEQCHKQFILSFCCLCVALTLLCMISLYLFFLIQKCATNQFTRPFQDCPAG